MVLEARIDEWGRVASVEVLQGVTPGLDAAAVSAVETWRFTPATLDGEPIAVIYSLTVQFALR